MKKWYIGLVLTLVILVSGAIYFFPSSLDNSQTYEGTELTGEASDFQLTDQNNSLVRLSDFRGKVVVLTFMDGKCTDTCPVTGAHFRRAYEQLDEKAASQVVFLGVNVNVEANTVADVLESTRGWHLDEIPNWHFLTGTSDLLEPVWQAYGVTAMHSHEGDAIMHTPGTFLIDRLGQKRWYVSTILPGEGEVDLALPLSDLLLKHIHELLVENNNGS